MTMTSADLRPVPSADDGVVEGPRAERPKRRTFSAEYKAAIVAEYDAAADGEKGAVLRREGLYSSHVIEWRRARDAGALAGLEATARVPKRTAEQAEIDRLRARAERAEAELARTRAALDLVGKAHALLEMLSESAASEKPSRP
jgi:transposase